LGDCEREGADTLKGEKHRTRRKKVSNPANNIGRDVGFDELKDKALVPDPVKSFRQI
jgi:hypothetical protein